MTDQIQLTVAAKAFIVYDKKILLLRESNQYRSGTNAGKYDVPGGRVKPGERFDAGLQREIKEETGLMVTIGKPFFVNEWRPTINGTPTQIIGTFFICATDTPAVTLSPDHDDYQWIDPAAYQENNLIENLYGAFEAYLHL